MNIERVYGSFWRACILGVAQPSCEGVRVKLALIRRTNAPEVAELVEPVFTRCHDGTVAVLTAGYTLSPTHPHRDCIEVARRHIKVSRGEIRMLTPSCELYTMSLLVELFSHGKTTHWCSAQFQ
jgi:hypothetical protein